LDPKTTVSFPGAAKLESFGPTLPAKPFPSLEPKILPLPSPAKPDDAPLPNPNPVVGFPPKAPKPLTAGVVVVDVVDPALANAPNPDILVLAALTPNTLGFVAPRLPKGEVLELARDANPEVANAEADVCGLSLDMVKDKGLLIDSVFSSVPSVVDFAGSEEAESTCEKVLANLQGLGSGARKAS
jgi:hypothetical protein